MYEGILLDIDT